MLSRILVWHAFFQGFLQVDSVRKLARRPGGVQTKKDVLVIIDMLNDYDCAFNQQEYGYNKNPWCGDMSGTSFNITKVIAAEDQHWDLVVFVQDWLIATICEVYGWGEENYFCIRGTNGAQPMAELRAAVSQEELRQLAYTKNQNDAFTDKKPNPDLAGPNLPVPVPIDYPDRGYDVNNSFGGQLLVEVLSSYGFGPEDAKLSIVGTLADMCVMTSTVHASFLGYAVDVYEPAIHGGHDGPWDWCDIPRPSSNEPLPDNWQELVWSCQGAAGREAALEYMHAAGATIVYDLPGTPNK